jgi:glycosyltransferase involved in cell wall biosynthesis
MNKLAVLIPVYRNPSGLRRALESLSEAAGSFDVVIVDDGSPEPICAPTRLREDVEVLLLRLERNRGIAAALNCGLRRILELGYPYVGRLDAGDTVVAERFERQVEFLEAEPGCAAVSSFVDFVDRRQMYLFSHRPPCDHASILERLHLNNCILHPASMIRASALRECGIYREDAPGAEDYELFLRLSRRYELAVLPEVLTHCEYSPRGLSISGRRRQQKERLKLQVRYFDPKSPHSFLGIARTLLAMVAPQAAVCRFKRAFAR